ncbi:MAG: hypothetical protein QG622_858 [Actinomycetota bacterium]|nr:hypothetical protein [Actinomycetota bacterium]
MLLVTWLGLGLAFGYVIHLARLTDGVSSVANSNAGNAHAPSVPALQADTEVSSRAPQRLAADVTDPPANGASTVAVTPGIAGLARSARKPDGTLAADFADLQDTLNVHRIGVAFAPVGSDDPMELGDWTTGAAWSTIKVALSIAVFREPPNKTTTSLVHNAITRSDNAAAEKLWAHLGGGRDAAAAVDAVLADHGDGRTKTQPDRTRASFTPFGQTTWSLADQVVFASHLACTSSDSKVVEEMRSVTPEQRWGLGRLPGAAFKGGWGPDLSGRYLVRQFGVVEVHGRSVAVAIAAEPRSGTFADGTAALNRVAAWLARSLPPQQGSCVAAAPRVLSR